MAKKNKDVVRDKEAEELPESDLYYNVEDNPPIAETLFFGFQLAVANICYIIMFVVMLQSLICADQDFSSKMFSTVSFMVGLTTMLQTYIGVRMPIFQGPTPIFFLPYLTAATDPRWGCNAGIASRNETLTRFDNMSSMSNVVQEDEGLPPWTEEWAKVSGSLMLAELVQVVLALTGVIAMVMRFIRPVTIAVIFILLGIWLHDTIADFTKVHWGISALSVATVLILSQYLYRIKVPMPAWKRGQGFYWTRFPLFELFPVLIGVGIVWAISAIITVAGGFPDDPTDIRYKARTDIYGETIRKAPVFRFPYPGQFSWIDFSVEYFIVNLVAVLMTTMESMGDYCQYALTCCLPRPPAHAFNRGIFMEGFCGFFSALVGMGHPTTSYSNIVGIVRVTKVASRLVFVTGGAMLMILGIFGKVGAIFVSIPKSVLAGPVFVGWGLLIGATFMNLKQVDLAKMRNQTTIGCSLMLGCFVPFYFQDHMDEINTGSSIGDRIIVSIVTIPFLVGGLTAIFLDNTLPGLTVEPETDKTDKTSIDESNDDDNTTVSPADGLLNSEENGHVAMETAVKKIDLGLRQRRERRERMIRLFDPPFITKYTRRWAWTRYVSILPNPYKRGERDGEEKEKVKNKSESLKESNV